MYFFKFGKISDLQENGKIHFLQQKTLFRSLIQAIF